MKELLKSVFGYESLRTGQQPLVDALLQGKDALGIMPTGAGKSLCFQLPALCMDGITLVVSPLISLMKDQVMNLVQQGVAAAFLNSSLTVGQYAKATANMQAGKYKIIYVAPERLMTERFLWAVQGLKISMIAVDEAHCVSQWGQDFRPAYLQIAEFIRQLPSRPPVAAFTATATPKVHRDIVKLLELQQPKTVVTGFNRPNLRLMVLKPRDKDRELLRLLQNFGSKSGVIYCSTRKQVEQVQQLLQTNGISAACYHAGLEDSKRHTAQEDFVFDRVQVIVATNAFGMGIDKPDIRFVIHYNMPLDLESYYQEAGRAGRDGEPAECVLLYSGQDVRMGQFLIEKSVENQENPDPEMEERAKERLKRMTWYCTSRRCLRRELLGYFGESASPFCGNCSICLQQENHSLQEASLFHRKDKARYQTVDAKLFEMLCAKRNELAKRQGMPAFVIFTDAVLREMCLFVPENRSEFLKVNGVGEEKTRRYGQEMLAVISQWKEQKESE